MQAYVLLSCKGYEALRPVKSARQGGTSASMHEPAGGRVNSRGRSRGVQQGAVHQGAIISIVDQIVGCALLAAFLGLVDNFNLDRVLGVVEINDMNVKDQHSGARN